MVFSSFVSYREENYPGFCFSLCKFKWLARFVDGIHIDVFIGVGRPNGLPTFGLFDGFDGHKTAARQFDCGAAGADSAVHRPSTDGWVAACNKSSPTGCDANGVCTTLLADEAVVPFRKLSSGSGVKSQR